MTHSSDGRPRARGLGITLPGEPGPLNAITDVGGVEVGVTTLIGGTSVRTGVTAICRAAAKGSAGRAPRAGTRSMATAR
jgi:L-aminopeptidase/D-esterase-like protein